MTLSLQLWHHVMQTSGFASKHYSKFTQTSFQGIRKIAYSFFNTTVLSNRCVCSQNDVEIANPEPTDIQSVWRLQLQLLANIASQMPISWASLGNTSKRNIFSFGFICASKNNIIKNQNITRSRRYTSLSVSFIPFHKSHAFFDIKQCPQSIVILRYVLISSIALYFRSFTSSKSLTWHTHHFIPKHVSIK